MARAAGALRPPAGGAHPVDEVLNPGPTLVHGLQHVVSRYAVSAAMGLIPAEGPVPGLEPDYQPGQFPRERDAAGPASAVRRATADRRGD